MLGYLIAIPKPWKRQYLLYGTSHKGAYIMCLPININNNENGLTIIEILIAMFIFVIVIAGMGYIFYTVAPSSQRAYHVNQMDHDISIMIARLRSDMGKVLNITSPALPSATSAPNCQYLKTNPITLSINDSGTQKNVVYQFSANQIQRCVNGACEDLLTSWDDGYVAADNSTKVCRGIDVDNDGSYTLRELNMLRLILVLDQYEGYSGHENKIFSRTYYFEILPNLSGIRY